jgi:hypothetical protein
MSDPTLPKVDPIGYIRTYVPLGIGLILGWLITKVPVVADAILWLDANLPDGFDWRSALDAIAIALVTAGYYRLAREIGRRWPAAEKFLLGSSATPTYR